MQWLRVMLFDIDLLSNNFSQQYVSKRHFSFSLLKHFVDGQKVILAIHSNLEIAKMPFHEIQHWC